MGLIGEGMDLLKLANKAQNADLYRELVGWVDKVGELQKQNEELTTERNQLRDQVRFKGVMERINGHVFVQGDDEEICPRCAEVERLPVHLVSLLTERRGMRTSCPSCRLELPSRYPRKKSEPETEDE